MVVGECEQARTRVVERLRARRLEIDEVIFTRTRDLVADAAGLEDPEYVSGLRTAVTAAVDYVLEGIEQIGESGPHIPSAVVAQARRAARAGVGLDTLLRRYVVGLAILEDFVMQEADHGDLLGQRRTLRRLLETSASLLDRLIPVISSAYWQELEAGGARVRRKGTPAPDRRKQGPYRMKSAFLTILGAPSAGRARECLLFLAGHPDSSNLEVAAGIGVVHQSQISRLLAYLVAENLVDKRSEGVGKRNSLRLTARGERIARALADQRD